MKWPDTITAPLRQLAESQEYEKLWKTILMYAVLLSVARFVWLMPTYAILQDVLPLELWISRGTL